jgi:hypothetical protein
MASRTWRWLEVRILGLLDAPIISYAPNGRPVYGTRLQERVYGPAADAAVKEASKRRAP